jgi:hypothetical protein
MYGCIRCFAFAFVSIFSHLPEITSSLLSNSEKKDEKYYLVLLGSSLIACDFERKNIAEGHMILLAE